jgi:predicted HTH domain antitoxin
MALATPRKQGENDGMESTLSLELPSDLLHSARMTVDEVKVELAVLLFERERVSLGRAAAFAGMPVGEFLTLLASRKIGCHGSVSEALEDARKIETLLDAGK